MVLVVSIRRRPVVLFELVCLAGGVFHAQQWVAGQFMDLYVVVGRELTHRVVNSEVSQEVSLLLEVGSVMKSCM